MLHGSLKKKVETRLKRIEGQVSGIRRMVEGDKYCVDVLIQIAAARAALAAVGKLVLGQHIESCVSAALTSGSERERQDKLDELVDVFARYSG